MPIQHSIWKIGTRPEPLRARTLEREEILEEMIVHDISIVSDQWMLVGRQIDAGSAGRIDLLALAPDGSTIVIELKRNRTPREVVAQSIDYASWIEKQTSQGLANIYQIFSKGGSLGKDFKSRFGHDLEEDSINQSHQVIIVASKLDDSSERIIQYLSSKDIPINVFFFQVFELGTEQLLSRAWLIDPTETQIIAARGSKETNEPWNGEFYVSYGADEARSWEEAVKYGFICGGGGEWYSKTLQLLNPEDKIWVKIPGKGFVGHGIVTGPTQSINDFRVKTDTGEKYAIDVLKGGHYHRDRQNNPETCEYFVPVRWIQTFREDEAFTEVGLFGNQNTVCRPTTPKWRHTVDRLRQRFKGSSQE